MILHHTILHYSFILFCIILYYDTIPYYVEVFTLGKVAVSIILPAKTEPIWTLSEPVIKTLCLRMGGGCTPLLSFSARQACSQEHHTMNKTCTKHRLVSELISIHLNGILLPIEEVRPTFFKLSNVASSQQRQNPHGPAFFLSRAGLPFKNITP